MPRLFTLIAIALLSACTTVELEGGIRHTFFPWEVRHISPEGSTSQCLGDFTDPICAVETGIACIAGKKLPECKMTGILRRDPDNEEVPEERVEYIIYRSGIANEDKFAYAFPEPDSNCFEDCPEPIDTEPYEPRHFQAFFISKYCNKDMNKCPNEEWGNTGLVLTEFLKDPDYGHYWYIGVLQAGPREKDWYGED